MFTFLQRRESNRNESAVDYFHLNLHPRRRHTAVNPDFSSAHGLLSLDVEDLLILARHHSRMCPIYGVPSVNADNAGESWYD
jgi:hypothetical protein